MACRSLAHRAKNAIRASYLRLKLSTQDGERHRFVCVGPIYCVDLCRRFCLFGGRQIDCLPQMQMFTLPVFSPGVTFTPASRIYYRFPFRCYYRLKYFLLALAQYCVHFEFTFYHLSRQVDCSHHWLHVAPVRHVLLPKHSQ